MSKVHYEKTLYGLNKNKGIKVWSISVIEPEWLPGMAVIKALHGIEGGKMAANEKTIKVGKNIGKSNETTPIEQAISEAKSTEQRKRDSGYADTAELAKASQNPFFKPMLASSWDKHSHKINFPCYVQPKLDGCRMLAEMNNDGEVSVWSRGRKVIDTVDHIKSELKLLLKPGEAVDGEIYVHGWTFQRITKAIKKKREDTLRLEYHIYDAPKISHYIKFRNRFEVLSFRESVVGIWEKGINHLKLVNTKLVKNIDELTQEEEKAVKLNYEGLMVRNVNSEYLFGHRSYDLQKVKRFEDSEFTIVGVTDGVGKEEGAAVFTVSDNSVTFNVRPTGTHEERKRLYQNRSKLIGKTLTVKFQGKSEDGVPRFPVGVGIREDWDM